MNNKVVRIVIGIVVLFVVFSCGLIAGMSGGDSTDEGVVTRVVYDEVVVEETRIVEVPVEVTRVVAVYTEVTRIVEVEVEPEVIETVVVADPPPVDNDAIADYATSILLHTVRGSVALGSVGTLFTDASNNPFLIFDDSWTGDVLDAAAEIEEICTALVVLVAPETLEEVQANLVLACDDLVAAAGYIRAFALSPDLSGETGIQQLTMATLLMSTGGEYLIEATALLEKN